MASSRAYKKTRSQSYSSRKVETRQVKQRFLIVCEGKKTEKNYFDSFRVPKKVVGLGRGPLDVVKQAIAMSNDEYDQVWCVFDRDPGPHSWPKKAFHKALSLARQKGFHVAYSNESFELWFLLHFHYYHTPIPRADCCEKLSKLLGVDYDKTDDSLYDKLLDKQPDAIKNANRLLAQYRKPNPEKNNPSTTVHLLVIELNKFV